MKYLLLSISFFPLLLPAQTIERVQFRQEGREVRVFYDLIGEANAAYEVSLYYSWDGGKNFLGPAADVSGAIGIVQPGYDRQIHWLPFQQMGPLVSDEFVLRVQATYTPPLVDAPPNKDLPTDMVLVRGGTFTMGSPSNEEGRFDDEIQHQVTISDFYMGQYEVTFDQYDTFCKETGRKTPDDEGWSRGQRPVINVSWYDAIEYCNWRSKQENRSPFYIINETTVTANWQAKGYRLPTEAEWEYAARGGGLAILFGNGQNILDPSQANFDAREPQRMNVSRAGIYQQKTLPIGSLTSPNVLGLHDMSGNVSEWCWDWFGSYPSRVETDPKGPATGDNRVFRGGGWADGPRSCRVAYRGDNTPSYYYSFLGFRLSLPY